MCTHSILAAQVKHPEHIMAKQIHTIFFNTLIVFVPIHITPPFAACGACRSAESEAGLGNASKALMGIRRLVDERIRSLRSKQGFDQDADLARQLQEELEQEHLRLQVRVRARARTLSLSPISSPRRDARVVSRFADACGRDFHPFFDFSRGEPCGRCVRALTCWRGG